MPPKLTLASSARFVRRTALHPDEQRINFTQTDNEVLDLIASDEAAAVTPHMNRIYTRLQRAASKLWERPGVLHLIGEEDEQGGWMPAFAQLAKLCGVARATALKAMKWMHAQGIIGYDSYKNGIGIRIFLNRAAASIRKLAPAQRAARPVAAVAGHGSVPSARPAVISRAAPPAPSSTDDARSSTDELPFKVFSFGEAKNTQDTNPRASANDHQQVRRVGEQIEQGTEHRAETLSQSAPPPSISPAQIAAAVAAAAEQERGELRAWFERHAIPKMVRIAQAETYKLMRRGGTSSERDRQQSWAEVGKYVPSELSPAPPTPEEIAEFECRRLQMLAELRAL